MALMQCPECSHDMSDQAQACPNCGHPAEQPLGSDPLSADGSIQASPNSTQRTYGWVLAASGVAIAVGSILPWRSLSAPLLGTVNIAGTEGDGILTLLLGALIAVLGIVVATRTIGKAGGIVAVLASALCAFVGITGLASSVEVINEINSDLESLGRASIGVGLWLVLLGCIGAIVSSLVITTTSK